MIELTSSTASSEYPAVITSHIIDEIKQERLDVLQHQNLKVIIVGDSGVGKTALASRICYGKFPASDKATIGFEFFLKETRVEEIPVTLQIWDTAGQERFRSSLIPRYYQGADAVIFVYDVSEPQTYATLPSWFSECKKHIPFDTPPAFLVANKTDAVDESNFDQIYRPENPGKKLANTYNFAGFYAISAKSTKQPQTDFEDILEEVGKAALKAKRKKLGQIASSKELQQQRREVITLHQDPSPPVYGRRREGRLPSPRPLRNPCDDLDSHSYEWVERPPRPEKDGCC